SGTPASPLTDQVPLPRISSVPSVVSVVPTPGLHSRRFVPFVVATLLGCSILRVLRVLGVSAAKSSSSSPPWFLLPVFIRVDSCHSWLLLFSDVQFSASSASSAALR